MADEKGKQRGLARWWLAALAFALALLGASLPLALPWRCPVTRAASERIKEGMTLAQVEEILGGPPGDYRTRPPAPRGGILGVVVILGPLHRREEWHGDEGTVVVGFQDDDTVMYTNFKDAEPHSPGLVELVRWRAGKIRDRLGR